MSAERTATHQCPPSRQKANKPEVTPLLSTTSFINSSLAMCFLDTHHRDEKCQGGRWKRYRRCEVSWESRQQGVSCENSKSCAKAGKGREGHVVSKGRVFACDGIEKRHTCDRAITSNPYALTFVSPLFALLPPLS